MSLVTVLRSPSSESGSLATDSEIDEDQEDSSTSRSRASSFEGFFASKGAAYALPDGDFARRATKTGGEMQLHLQAMVNLLRDEDVLRLVVKLESQWPKRIRYLTVVSAFGPNDEEESIIMGVDWTDKATIGLVVPLYRDTNIKLDGDGGFTLTSAEKTHDLKPVSVQTMWTAFQWIHKCADNARRHNYYPTGVSHAWVNFYLKRITSDRSCLNEWNQMSDLLSKRVEPSPDSSPEKELIMKLIRHKLREVMLRVDLEEVTCRQIRTMLEEDTQMELKEYKGFIDEEMLTILGQMDSASKIFDHVYLGSEWNASNMEELKENGVGYILNVTREIDNFFPGTFCYYNIRVYDLDETELLHHWEDTYKFIQKAKEAGSKVLVHCKMGISRSASTVIAYGMKEYGWSLGETMKHVKARRSCVQPNSGFWKQLITYEGILNSSKQRYNKLFSDRRTQSDSSDSEERSRRIRPTKKTTKKYNTIEGTIPTIRDISRADHALSEGVDSVDNVRTRTESLTSKDDSSSEESEDELVEQQVPTEDIEGDEDNVFFDLTVSTEKSEMAAVFTAGTLDMSQTALSTSGNEDVSDSTFENRSLSSGIPTVEKTLLHRVCSVPTLPIVGHVRQELLVDEQGNFKRSSSLRERGRKKVKELTLEEGKSASAENIRKSSPGGKLDFQWDPRSDSVETFTPAAVENVNEPRNETEELQLEEVTPIENVEMETNNYAMETETVEEPNMHGSLPRDLLGVLESGFVKRHSRNFEEGIVNLPCETETLDNNVPMEEENCYMSSDKPDQSEQVESTPGEEPEPGLVKKHKEGYEMKHRESMERTLAYKRGLSGEGESAILEQGAEESSDAACSPLQKDSDGQLTEAIEGETRVPRSKTESDDPSTVSVDVEALIRKVNVDMKKEVMSRRISRSRKDQESGTPEGNAMDQVKGSPGIPMNEDLRQEGESVTEALDMQKEEGVTSEIPVAGIVKRNTLILEGKARDLVLGYVTCTETYELRGDAADSTETERLLSHLERDHSVEPCGLFGTPSGGTARDEDLKSPEEKEDKESQQDLESIPQRGLVKRHTLLIEERIQPLEQEITKAETEKEAETIAEVTAEKNGDTSSKEERMRYQIELASGDKEEVETGDDFETVSGLVQREKLRIEEKFQPVVVESKQLDSEVQAASEDTLVLESDAVMGGSSQESDTAAQGGEIADDPDIDKETVVGVDTSSVVRVKEQTQHLESVLREGQTGNTLRRQTSAEEVTKVDDTLPKIVIIPRSASMEIANSPKADTPTSEAMETLSHSAVCLALKKAQESCESEQGPLVDWETGNVKQRTQILEEIIRDGDKENQGIKRSEIERKGSAVRRHESLPKTVGQPEKLALRRRSFSDITENSSTSKREVVYTVQRLADSSAQSSSSSSLPKDWSPLQDRQENMARKRAKVDEFPPDNFREPEFQPDNFREPEFQEKPRFDLIDCLESPRESVVSVKEKIQIIDSKNQKNIANIS